MSSSKPWSRIPLQRMLCLVDTDHGLQEVKNKTDGTITLECGCTRRKLTSELVAERNN